MKKIEIVRGGTTFTFEAPKGIYSFSGKVFSLNGLSPALYMNGAKTSFGAWKIVKESETGMTAQASGKSGIWDFKASVDKNGKLVLGLSCRLKEPCEDLDIRYFENAAIPADHLAAQGNKTGGCELYKLTGKDVKKEDFKSASVMTITKKKVQLTVSSPLRGDHLESYTGRVKKGGLEDVQAGAVIRHITAKNIKLKELSIREGDGFQALYAYADENCKLKRDLSPYVAPGWNSWDYYRWTITEDEVLENAEFIAHDPVLSKHVKKIIIDDGWQYAYGEWKANSYFPHGMKWMAEQLKKLKFMPGLWVAPNIIEPQSWIAQMEPDMLAKAENGQGTLCWECMKRHGFILDPTVEKSRKFIYDLFDRLVKDGFEYFKVDFLWGLYGARQFTDKKVGRGNLVDLTLGPAREAINGKAHLLGCGYPFCGGEIVDMARVGGDIHSRWSSIKANTPSIALRYWANKKLWINDPDFALCRGFDTSEDPAMNQMRCCLVYVKPDEKDPDFFGGKWKLVDVNRSQAEVLLSLVICAGGSVNLSDKMTRLNESGLDLARRTVAAESGDAALPLDLFSENLPKYWVQKVGDHHRVLMINWEDAPAVLRIDLNQLGLPAGKLRNFWNDKAVKAKNGVIEVELAPRSCLFTEVR